jgi:hypothetical protein
LNDITSSLKPTSEIPCYLDIWAAKNTSFAAQNYMLAATSFGLATSPMEGFDERKLCQLLNIPQNNYCVPLIISTGYPASTANEACSNYNNNSEVIKDSDRDNDRDSNSKNSSINNIDTNRKKIRYKPEDICFANKYGIPMNFSNSKL